MIQKSSSFREATKFMRPLRLFRVIKSYRWTQAPQAELADEQCLVHLRGVSWGMNNPHLTYKIIISFLASATLSGTLECQSSYHKLSAQPLSEATPHHTQYCLEQKGKTPWPTVLHKIPHELHVPVFPLSKANPLQKGLNSIRKGRKKWERT